MKRMSDIVGATLGLIAAAPILLVIAALVRVTVGSPVLFRQPRAGLRGRQFMLIKFRTMKDVRGVGGRFAPDSERLTSLGRFLRATSLDELPELWNVLRGDMSLVGPRPLLMEYLPLYSPEQARRHDVRPGITGWAQINGRNTLSWEEKFMLDVWYVDNVSFWLDIRILLLTGLVVLRRHGVDEVGGVGQRLFEGSAGR